MNASGHNHAEPPPYLEDQLAGDLQRRLSRIEGHVRGIKKMLDEERDCDDILTQVAGVNAALQRTAIRLLEGHLETCLKDAVQGGDSEVAMVRFKASLSRVLR